MTPTSAGDPARYPATARIHQLRAARELATPDWAAFADHFFRLGVRAAALIDDDSWLLDFSAARHEYEEAHDAWIEASQACVDHYEITGER